MKLPFFASFIVFVLWLTYELKKPSKASQEAEAAYWEREAKANATRRKSLDSLPYIVIPYDVLPLSISSANPNVVEYQTTLRTLADKKIVNLTGISNTDLKLEYGVPNLSLLTEYDQNYTLLARTLQRLAECYHQEGLRNEAKALLEFAVSTVTDISGSYRLLATIYTEEGEPFQIDSLISQAEKINGIMKNTIVRTLQELNPYNG